MPKFVTICIIDDDDIYQFAITRTIIKHEIDTKNILVFSDGKEAITYITQNVDKTEDIPDVIFLDINMPVMDGWQFLDGFLKINSNIQKKVDIYMVSSSVDPADIDRAKKINVVTDYLVKPLSPEILKKIIEFHNSNLGAAS